MFTSRVGPGTSFWLSLVVAMSGVTFAIGLAAGYGLPRTSSNADSAAVNSLAAMSSEPRVAVDRMGDGGSATPYGRTPSRPSGIPVVNAYTGFVTGIMAPLRGATVSYVNGPAWRAYCEAASAKRVALGQGDTSLVQCDDSEPQGTRLRACNPAQPPIDGTEFRRHWSGGTTCRR